MTLRVAVQMDPVHGINIDTDTTFLMMENAQARANQAKLEWLKENPAASPDELEKLGQMVFTAETIEGGNVKGFVALMRERSRRKALEIDSAKLAILRRWVTPPACTTVVRI